MGFSRQEYWSGLPCPPPWDCTQVSHIAGDLQADSLLAELTGKPNDHIRLSVFSIIIHSSELPGYGDKTLDLFYVPILQACKTEDRGLFVPGPCLIHQGIERYL